MAFKKTMAQRLLSISRGANPTPAALRQPFIPSDSGRPQLFARDRIRLDGLIPPSPDENQLTARDLSKLMRAAQLEMVKAHVRSRGRQNNWVSYSEFVEMCKEGCGGNKERGAAMAKLLDDSGAVIVLANSSVCLHPREVVGAVQGLISPLPMDPRGRRELEEMEREKAEIDRAAEAMVRRELWAGLGYLVVQTAAFVRLTFWELSWDVMEPICFYVTSAYFMGGYAFFLRTSMEPSFEGFFRARFAAKQKRLFTARGFDINKYNQLAKACNFHSNTTPSFARSPVERCG